MKKIQISIALAMLLNNSMLGATEVYKSWSDVYGSTGQYYALDDYGNSVATDISGNVYIAGSTSGDLDGNTNSGYNDIFLSKYSTAGVRLWTKQYGSSGDHNNEVATSITTDKNGNIYISGWTLGAFDGYTELGGYDIFLTKFSSNGTRLWTEQYGTVESEQGLGVITDSEGNIYVTGYTEGNLDGNINPRYGSPNIILSKFQTDGTRLWTEQYGNWYEWGASVAIDSMDTLYVTGTTYGSLDGNANSGAGDIFLSKFDTDGVRFWTQQYGSSREDGYGVEDIGSSVATDSSGAIYITGSTTGNLDGDTNSSLVVQDIFLTKFDSAGNLLWTDQYGNEGTIGGTGPFSRGRSVAVDKNNYIYVTGYTSGSLDGNTYYGWTDIFLTQHNSEGTRLWTQQYGDSSHQTGRGVVVDYRNDLYIAGYTHTGNDDILIYKFSSLSALPSVLMYILN